GKFLGRFLPALVEVLVGTGDVNGITVGDERNAAACERVLLEVELVRVEPVERGGLALGVNRDERQRPADANGRADVAAIGEIFFGRHGELRLLAFQGLKPLAITGGPVETT